MSVCFCTFAHPPRYVKRLHDPGVLRAMVDSHRFAFDEVVVIHNQCRAADYQPFDYPCRTVDLPREQFTPLMLRHGIDPDNRRCDEITHGEGAPHFWPCHVVNHLCGMENTTADWIVFADCDTRMVSQPTGQSWIDKGMALMDKYPQVLIVSPGDGGQNGGPGEGGRIDGNVRLTRNVSQQLFLCRGDEFRYRVKFDEPWDGQFNAPSGPFPEFYCLLEGRLWRHMDQIGKWRAILPDVWRYYHNSYWATDREREGWGPYA